MNPSILAAVFLIYAASSWSETTPLDQARASYLAHEVGQRTLDESFLPSDARASGEFLSALAAARDVQIGCARPCAAPAEVEIYREKVRLAAIKLGFSGSDLVKIDQHYLPKGKPRLRQSADDGKDAAARRLEAEAVRRLLAQRTLSAPMRAAMTRKAQSLAAALGRTTEIGAGGGGAAVAPGARGAPAARTLAELNALPDARLPLSLATSAKAPPAPGLSREDLSAAARSASSANGPAAAVEKTPSRPSDGAPAPRARNPAHREPDGFQAKGASAKNRYPPVLGDTKCRLIFNMVQDEKRYGNVRAATMWSITFPGEKKMGNHFTNPVPYDNLTPTAAGDIDLDWYMDLTVGAGGLPNIPGKSLAVQELYLNMKGAWEGVTAIGSLFGLYKESNDAKYHFEKPYDDPGENVAVAAVGKGLKIADLFPEPWFRANCLSLYSVKQYVDRRRKEERVRALLNGRPPMSAEAIARTLGLSAGTVRELIDDMDGKELQASGQPASDAIKNR
ncbi:MAG: hypothetical protein KGJ84_11690 [Elusimicrobia bacterium]|nr:hypothetical protein [Elusimicrobiota bacterium]